MKGSFQQQRVLYKVNQPLGFIKEQIVIGLALNRYQLNYIKTNNLSIQTCSIEPKIPLTIKRLIPNSPIKILLTQHQLRRTLWLTKTWGAQLIIDKLMVVKHALIKASLIITTNHNFH